MPTQARSGSLYENSSIVVVIDDASLADLITRKHLLMYWGDLEGDKVEEYENRRNTHRAVHPVQVYI